MSNLDGPACVFLTARPTTHNSPSRDNPGEGELARDLCATTRGSSTEPIMPVPKPEPGREHSPRHLTQNTRVTLVTLSNVLRHAGTLGRQKHQLRLK